mmetsp:Transcript_14652/g.47711  ORF Transcript_14652/g.47711 Transcript_14652/m.47711 type:complete len:95 (+) Transcript_14652:948-1232(+)
MRCAKQDHTTCTMTLHYLANGAMRVRVLMLRQEVFIPLVLLLRALLPEATDREMFYHIVNRAFSDSNSALFESSLQCNELIFVRNKKVVLMHSY